jgi:hypothetical protein
MLVLPFVQLSPPIGPSIILPRPTTTAGTAVLLFGHAGVTLLRRSRLTFQRLLVFLFFVHN